MIVDFSNIVVFLVWYVITVGLLYSAYKFKKSVFALIPVIYFLLILGVTAAIPGSLQDVFTHRIFNFLGLGFSIVFYIVIDDIEVRRRVISKVFKNRYKNNETEEKAEDDKTKETKKEENAKTESK